MATKAETFEVEARRDAQDAHGGRKRPPRAGVAGAAARAALVARHDGAGAGIPHNAAPRASARSTYELEASRSGPPPRKSTRRSPTHLKPDSVFGSRPSRRPRRPRPAPRASSPGAERDPSDRRGEERDFFRSLSIPRPVARRGVRG